MDQQSRSPLARLLTNYPWRQFKKGQTILFQGEVPRYAYVIKEGVVRTYNISANGDEQIITLSAPYDILPEAWYLRDASTAYYFYGAYTDCKVYLVPREELLHKVASQPELSQALLQRAMRLHVGAKVHINALEQPKSRDKLVYLLYYLMLRFGDDASKGKQRINLRLTHQTLADMLGTTRETIALELSRLRKEHVIDYSQQLYTVDTAKLQALRNDEDFITRL
jgi:CRP/FNR family transcriptional regulator, cyclic AMP receptor protein